MSMTEMIWDILNSPAVITALAALFLYVLNKIYTKKPLWKKYEGTVISAIRYAEKAIPDDAENKSLARLDAALNYALEIIEKTEKRVTTDKERAEIKDGISVIHNAIEE